MWLDMEVRVIALTRCQQQNERKLFLQQEVLLSQGLRHMLILDCIVDLRKHPPIFQHDICQITAYGFILKYCITVYCPQNQKKRAIINWGDGIFLWAVGAGTIGDHRLDWGHQVGALLQQWFDNWPITPPEGSPATPGVPGVPPSALDPLLAPLLLLRGPDAGCCSAHKPCAASLDWIDHDFPSTLLRVICHLGVLSALLFVVVKNGILRGRR